MDTTKGKSRYDFNTEEEWMRYKETREQAPKAAFQFGVKSADGRKKGGAEVGGWVLRSVIGVVWTGVCRCRPRTAFQFGSQVGGRAGEGWC